MAVLRAAVLGRPVGHSRSPVLHEAAYRRLGLDVDYGRVDLGEEQALAWLRPRLHGGPAGRGEGSSASPGEDWLGVSVTMPLKAVVLQAADEVDPLARRLGAANTLVRDHPVAPGRVLALNTDVEGIVRALDVHSAAGPSGPAPGGIVGVVGNGGTAAAAVAAAARRGARGVRIGARSAVRAQETARLARGLGLEAQVVDQPEVLRRAAELDAIVITLPPGAADGLVAAVPTSVPLPPLLDVAYDPWPSAVAAAWERAGGTVVSGLTMLLHQGVAQARLFTERIRRARGDAEPDWDAVTADAAAALGLCPTPGPPSGLDGRVIRDPGPGRA